MPRGDRSGPMGAGPMSGRGLGYCAGYPAPGYETSGCGRGWGAGRRGAGYGGGGGWRHRYYATGVPGWAAAPGWGPTPFPLAAGPVPGRPAPPAPPAGDEVATLKAQAEYLAAVLEETRSRLADIERKEEE